MSKKYLSLILFMAAYLWLNNFGRAILPVHILNQGLGITIQILGWVLTFAGQILLLVLFKKVQAKLNWYIAMILVLSSILLSINIVNISQFFLGSFLSGVAIALFWVPYNIAHFRGSSKEATGHTSGVLFSVFPAVSITAPILAGFLAEVNTYLVWGFVLISFLIATLLVKKQENFLVSYSVKAAWQEIKPVRVLLVLEGIWESLIFCIIPVYTLYFIQTPGFYGTFLAYLSLAGLVANLLLSSFTDRVKKRAVFIYPLTLAMSVVTFVFPFVTQDLFLWALVSGLSQFLVLLFWSISLAMVVDSSSNLDLAMPGREIALIVGRLFGALLVAASFLIEKTPFYIFFILGAVMLLFPINLYWNSKISKKYKYL
jgi:hypothetical protein